MAKNKKVLTVLSTAAITGLITAAVGSTAFAKTSGILLNNGSKDYKYDLTSLQTAFGENQMDSTKGALYQDYAGKLASGSVAGLYDNAQDGKVIDYSKAAAAFSTAQLNGTAFDINAYTQTSTDYVTPTAPIYDQAVASDGTTITSTPEVAPVTNLAVSSVSATNYKEIAVTFNEAVDPTTAGTSSNYTIGGDNSTVAVSSASVQADGKTVILTVSTNLTVQAADTLTVNGVNDLNGNTIATSTTNFKPLDVTVPTALSATVVGPETLKVTFSEPINVSSVVAVLDNNTYSIGSPAVVPGDTHSVYVTLGAPLPSGSHTITVSAAKDYAGFAAIKTDLTFNYTADTTPLTASIASATQNQVVIKFNKPVTTNRGSITVYHTYNNVPGYQPTPSPLLSWSADGTTATATFTTNYLPLGNATIYVNAGTGTSVAEDAWGNAFASTSFTAAITSDTTAPKVSSVKVVSPSQLDVTYSKLVTGATTPANYTLKDSNGNSVYVLSAVQDGTNPELYHLTLPVLTGGTYSLSIAGIKDTSIAQNALSAYATSVVIPDNTAPTVSGAAVTSDSKHVVVKFSKQVATTGAYSALDLNKYQINGTNASTIVGATISLGADGKSVVITLPTALVGLPTVNVGQVADLAGNTSALETSATVANDVITSADISNIKAVAKNEVQFDVNRELSGIVASDFTITTGGHTYPALSANYTNGAGKSTVTVTTATNVLPADVDTTNGANIVNLTTSALTDTLGTGVGSGLSVSLNATNDDITPSLVSAVTSDTTHDGEIDTITLKFDEPLYVASVDDADFAVAGYTVKSVTVDPSDNSKVTLTVNESGVPDLVANPKVTLVGAVQDQATSRNTAVLNQSVTSTEGADVASQKAAQLSAIISGATVTGTGSAFSVSVPTSATTATVQSLLANVTPAVIQQMGGSIKIGSNTAIIIASTGITSDQANTIASELAGGNIAKTAANTTLQDAITNNSTVTINGVQYSFTSH